VVNGFLKTKEKLVGDSEMSERHWRTISGQVPGSWAYTGAHSMRSCRTGAILPSRGLNWPQKRWARHIG
jgi:hypothetical protein